MWLVVTTLWIPTDFLGDVLFPVGATTNEWRTITFYGNWMQFETFSDRPPELYLAWGNLDRRLFQALFRSLFPAVATSIVYWLLLRAKASQRPESEDVT